jgi:8-oxo-dGTP pyrophosphatase MutT (NUDIX family)
MRRQSSVLLGIYNNESIILTKRSNNLRSFTGHICLPGGGIDSTDFDATDAAIREFYEELQYTGSVEPVYCLQKSFGTIKLVDHSIYTIVAKLNGQIYGYNPDEVEKIIYLPINWLKTEIFKPNTNLPVKDSWCFTYDDEFIWGITAYILKKYSEIKEI